MKVCQKYEYFRTKHNPEVCDNARGRNRDTSPNLDDPHLKVMSVSQTLFQIRILHLRNL